MVLRVIFPGSSKPLPILPSISKVTVKRRKNPRTDKAREDRYAIITPITTMINVNSQTYCLVILRTESFETWRD